MQTNRLKKELSGILQNLRRFAFSLTGNKQDADDLMQDTVIRILEKGAPDDADIRKWAFRVCKNIWLDGLRAKKVRSDWAKDQTETTTMFEDGVRVMEAKLSLKEVNAIMDKLPEDQRVLLSLVAVEGCSYREAADILDIPIGTVMSRVSRARAFVSDQTKAANLIAAPEDKGTVH